MTYLNPSLCVTLILLLMFTGQDTQALKQRISSKSEANWAEASTGGTHRRTIPKPNTKAEGGKEILYRNTALAVKYVGSKSCAQCHGPIYEEHIRSFHGQATSLPGQRPELRDLPPGGVTLCQEDSQRCFRVFGEGSDFFMSEFGTGPNGAELSKDTHKLEYAIGAPMAGTGYAVKRGDYLFEAPLSYYSGHQDAHPPGWSLSPGYENTSLGFSRPLVGSCMYCHVGRMQSVDDANNLYKDPPFSELAIGCENCHGPGQLHVLERSKNMPISGKVDTSIVNPARISKGLANDICTSCHELGEARVPQPGKKFSDFRPGTPLLDTSAVFKSRLIMGWNMEEWFDELKVSKCYRASGGRLGCINCHASHSSLTAEQTPDYFRAKCLTCHEEKTCTLPIAQRGQTTPPDNCISCHMPKHVAPSFVMPGTSGTSHRIVRSEGEPLPTDIAPQDSPDPATGLILINETSSSAKKKISPLVLLVAYQSVIGRNPERTDLKKRYDLLLDGLAKSNPENPMVLSALAKRELNKRSPEGNATAQNYLSKAVELDSKSPQDHVLLSELLYRSGHRMEAIAVLEKAVTLFPYVPTPYENLSICYMSVGDNVKARECVKKGLGIFPSNQNLLTIQQKLDRLQGSP